ncbi:MarR family winged helix-turn-helix transcriptional regulator [Kribbella jejuensis]|uniref:DNA-binding MarR family transcriptional regulator n=1 Tax=Kribbella jejuensis TaxID=236068 RepID=A0A542EV61_9ACTN|nr:MarR family winged helix-turn-helix transcriptional regulator [Kribbella jejuensis]TQJ19076.1 DNA-binding MarR family transcriptional regulator [Kribbella jejuensis]
MDKDEPDRRAAADADPVAAVEAAMIAIRRRQTRRTFAVQSGHGPDPVQEVLDAIEAAAPDPIGVNGVATALGVDQPRASKLTAAAVAAGLVRREADQTDGRRTNLVLTPAGQAQLDTVHTYRQAQFATAMNGWTPDEQTVFADLLTRFVAALDR